MLAPLVMGARMQIIAAEAVRPTSKGQRELTRMVAEKSEAALEASVAAQVALLRSGMRFWSRVAQASAAFMLAAPVLSTRAAAAPYRTRVRGNARRLTRN
jgi:hypothetical protein